MFSVRDSLLFTLDNMFQYIDYDAFLIFRNAHRIDQIEAEALSVPGVTAAEGWRFDNGRRMRPDDTESDPLQVRGVPAASALIRPRVVEGRWLLPEDENAIVVNTMFLKDEPDVKLGSQLKLKLNGRETDWQVVGIVAGTPPTPLLHANYPYLARVMGEVERAGVAIIVTHPRDPASQAAVARALEEHFKSVGMEVSYRQTSTEERTQIVARFNVLIVFLMIMAVLLAVVGAIGLTGTMSLNVLERTREIGVMRAIGASDGSVFQIVVIEGLLDRPDELALRRDPGVPARPSAEQRHRRDHHESQPGLRLLPERPGHVAGHRQRPGRVGQPAARAQRLTGERAGCAGV